MAEKLIDTHAHLTADELIHDVDAVVDRARRSGVAAIVCVGTDPGDCRVVDRLAGRYPDVFAACAIGPHEADRYDDVTELRSALPVEKLVAIGETGLDYHYDFADRSNQRRLFERHVELANELHLPMIVHCRDAFDDALAVVRNTGTDVGGVFHCFCGTADEADRVVQLGWYVSFAGILTFKKSDQLRAVAAEVPLNNVLIETDAPYLSPEPLRSRRPNEPANVRYVAEVLAETKDMEVQKLLEQVWVNAVRLFGQSLEGARQ